MNQRRIPTMPEQPAAIYERIQVRKALAYCSSQYKEESEDFQERQTLPETPLAKKISSHPPASKGQYSIIPPKSQIRGESLPPVSSISAQLISLNIQVDYGTSLERMIEKGNFDKVAEGFMDYFVSHEAYLGSLKRVELRCLCLNKQVTTIEIFNCLTESKGKLRMAVLEELLALATEKPLIQLQFPIFAMGSCCINKEGEVLFPVISSVGAKRNLALLRYFMELKWPASVRFLTVKVA